MADTPTTRGAYRKQGLGDRSAAWGLTSGLNGVFDSLDEAIHGFNGVSLATVNYTLSSTNYTTNEVRQRFHRFTNGGISANATITVPATQNWWLISNAVSGFDLVVSNGSNSVTIDDGLTALVATDGTNVYEFPMFSTLVAPDPGSNGIVVRTALGATVARTLTGPAAGITVTAGDGVSANPTLALANDLAAVEGLATTGLAVRTAADTWAARTLTGPAAGLSVAHGDGVSGNPTISLANDLLAVEALASTGLAVRTAADTWAVRTLSGPSAGVSIAHGDGVSGNPTISLANDLAAVEGLASTGLAVRTATDTWAARTLTGPAAGVTVTNGDGIAGNPTIALANDLSAIEGLASTGFAARTGTDTWAQRTLTAGDGIAITHGNGVSANPTIAVSGDATLDSLTVDFTTVGQAGEHAEEIDANATGTVTIQATDPTVLRRTLTGDVTLHVAGAPTPGYRNPNLLTYSEQFDNAAWTKSRATISADAIAAPDGRTTAYKFVEDGTASQTHQMSRGVSVTSGTPITLSVYAKAAERSRLSIAFTNAGAFSTVQRATFDLSTGIASSTQGTPTVAIEALSGGYYRCSITATPTSTATATSILYLDNGSTVVYTGDGSSGLYIWGAQLVTGSDPLVYRSVEATRQAYGYGWSTELRTTQDATGGRDLTILPANLLTYTEQFDNAAWTKSDTTVSANSIASPRGDITADKLIESATTAAHYAQASVTVATATLYALAVYAKAGERTRCGVQFRDASTGGNSIYADVNLTTGVVEVSGGQGTWALTSAAVIDDGDGWRRVVLIGTTGASISAVVRVFAYNGSVNIASPTYAGDGTSGLYLWGAQLVAGSSALGYAAVGATRAASVVWRGGAAAEIDYAAQAAAVESRIIIGVGSDGEILIDDVSVEA